MAIWKTLLNNLPEVAGPTQKKLSFKEKLKWTLIILVIFFVLGLFPLFGLGQNQLAQFEFLSIVLGAQFGSIISLGIGPIVTASIVLQLLNGSGIVKFDLTSPEGKRTFQGVQKLLALFFIVFEAIIYVMMGGLAPAPELVGTALFSQLQMLLIFQLILGGIVILFMDEVISKWGFGSGISLFIAAGVSQSIMVQALNPLPGPTGVEGVTYAAGAIPQLFQALADGNTQTAILRLASLISTVVVFLVVVYAQAMKVEIPLSFGRVRGHGIRWPLSFMYTSNIPVILVAALLANLQLWGRLMAEKGITWFGQFSAQGVPISGLVAWTNPVDMVNGIITGSLTSADWFNSLGYMILFIIGSVVFSIFWMQTAGMDARSQAKQMMSSGLQIPGFRKDERVLERILERYIWPLTVMGGAVVGFLGALADLTGALSRGTGILLAVMIVYKLYEEIAQQHMMDMHPAMRKFME